MDPPPPPPDLSARKIVAAPKVVTKAAPVVVSDGHDDLLASIRNHQIEKKERHVSPKRHEVPVAASAPSMFEQLMNVLD